MNGTSRSDFHGNAEHGRDARATRAGFTLAEILIVVGIIAVLVAVLLPAIGKAREMGKAAVCLSNLRQMATMAVAYANRNDGMFPIAQYRVIDATGDYSYCWDLTTIKTPGQPTRVVPGLLWGSGGGERIQQCPSFEGNANWAANPYTGYNYNTSYIGHGEGESDPTPARLAAVRNPTGVALFGDGQWFAGANKFMRAPFPNPGDAGFAGRWAGTQGFRHLKRTNVAYVDGHAESQADRFTANADGAANVAEGTGFLSEDNSAYDLK